MDLPLTALAWSALALLLVPLAYPLAAWLLARLAPAGPLPGDQVEAPLPGLSAVVCFVCEAEALPATVAAFLASDPELEKEIVLAGDGPTPAAAAAALALAEADPRVRLLLHPEPRGKARAQADAVRAARFPLVLCLDAGTRVAFGTPGRLARPLLDPAVAYTTGRLCYSAADPAGPGCGPTPEDRYWSLESALKGWEDRWAGPLGAAGGLFALRRRDYVPCPSGALVDMVVPCLVERLTGGRPRYLAEAVAWEAPRGSVPAWREARTRIQARALASVPLLHGWLAGAGPLRAFQFMGHKLLRWHAATSALVLGACGLGLLALGSPGPAGPLGALVAGSLAGSWILSRGAGAGSGILPALGLPGYAGEAQVRGLARALAGRVPECWQP